MDGTPLFQPRQASASSPGVVQNPHGGYQIHVRVQGTGPALIHQPHQATSSAPPGTPTLARMVVFEDCVLLELQEGQALVVHISDPQAAGSVLFFYHPNGTLWRVVPLEQLNPGWVMSAYLFRADLRKFAARVARMQVQMRWAAPAHHTRPTFWGTGGWSGAVMCLPLALVQRVREWQYSPLPEPHIVAPQAEQVETLQQQDAALVQQLLWLQAEGVEKVTYHLGGLHLVLSYLERIGLAETVNRYCPRQGALSEGLVITVLVLNRLLAPCALRNVAQWVADTGLHLLLGLPDPTAFNYDRLADALLAVYPHWQTIAAELTLQAVAQFQLAVETIHYDLTSVLFHGAYADSAWVEFGYSRDKRPDKRQINLGLSTTADGEVVLPGGSGIHAGNTTDVTTTVPAHQRLHQLFQRSDLLVTGDRIMQSAGNMLAIARAHGRFLGPIDWTPYIRRVVAGCPAADFVALPYSTQAGHTIKATARRLRFKVKEELSAQARKRLAQQRKQRGQRGRTPKYRQVHFWVRAAIIWDTARQEAAAARRQRRLAAYEADLQWTRDHLNKGRYYGDPEWVVGHLADLATQYQDVRSFVKVTFTQQADPEHMSLTWRRREDKIAQAARLDGKWVLVTNQPPTPGQSPRDYLDWMLRVYKNHGQVERRLRNLKSDLPLRPLYLHRDDEIVALCFVGVVALMVYTLIERDCQACPPLVEAGLRTAARVLAALRGFCLTVFQTPGGAQVFWLDTPTAVQVLLWRQLAVDDPGTRLPTVRLVGQ